MDTLGMRIKKIRTLNHLRQKDFAEKLFVSAPYVSMLEADKEQPTDMLLKLISLDFKISLSWLKDGNGEMIIGKGNDYFERENNENIKSELSNELLYFNTLLEKNSSSSINLSTSGMVQALGRILENKTNNLSLTTLIYEQIASMVIQSCDFVDDLNDKILCPETVSELFKIIRKISDSNYDCMMEVGAIYEKYLFKE